MAGAVAGQGLACGQRGEALREDALEGGRVAGILCGGGEDGITGVGRGGIGDQGLLGAELALVVLVGMLGRGHAVCAKGVLGGGVVGDGQSEDGVVLSQEGVEVVGEVLKGRLVRCSKRWKGTEGRQDVQ